MCVRPKTCDMNIGGLVFPLHTTLTQVCLSRDTLDSMNIKSYSIISAFELLLLHLMHTST